MSHNTFIHFIYLNIYHHPKNNIYTNVRSLPPPLSARNAEPPEAAKSLRLHTTALGQHAVTCKPSGISWSFGSCCCSRRCRWFKFAVKSERRFGVHVTGSPQRSRMCVYGRRRRSRWWVRRWRNANATINIGLGAAHPRRARCSTLNTDGTRYVYIFGPTICGKQRGRLCQSI